MIAKLSEEYGSCDTYGPRYCVEVWRRKRDGSVWHVHEWLLEEFIEAFGWWPWPGDEIPVVVNVA